MRRGQNDVFLSDAPPYVWRLYERIFRVSSRTPVPDTCSSLSGCAVYRILYATIPYGVGDMYAHDAFRRKPLALKAFAQS